MTTAFEEATALDARGDGEFVGHVDERFWVVRAPHGGYLAALLLRGLTLALDDPARAVRSFTTHFVAPAAIGPITLRTAVERTGRRMSVVSARAEQNGTLVALSLAAFSTAWDGLEFDDAPTPATKSPEEGFLVPMGETSPAFLRNVELSATVGDPMFSGSDRALVGGWIRMTEPAPADAPMIAMFMDAFAPAVWPVATQLVISPTIDFTIHFRTALPRETTAPDAWHFGTFHSSLAREGFFEEDGELWSADGTLVAQSRQLALALLPR